jgi:anti-sigma-K factor RskA
MMRPDELLELAALDAAGALGPEERAALGRALASADEGTRREVAALYDAALALVPGAADEPSATVRDHVLRHAADAQGANPAGPADRSVIGGTAVDVRCNELDEVVELYIAGALGAEDGRRLEQHASTCPRCARTLAEWSAVQVELAAAATDVLPSFTVRRRILDHASPEAVQSDRGTPSRARRDWRPWLAAAALLVLSAWLGYDSVRLRRSIVALESELASARARAAASEERLASLQDTATTQTRAVAVLTAPDLARIDLGGQAVAPSASARAFWSRSRGMVFSASALPPLPPGRVYQLWVVTPQAPVSVGLLEPDRDGRAQGVFVTPPDIQPVAVAVTLEPAGGVPAPTGEKYLVGVPGQRS